MAASTQSLALIIEDDRDTATLFSHILEFIGFKTEIVQSGEEALIQLKDHVPDIVLLDLKLSPKVSGFNLLEYINGQERLRKTRTIVITGYPNLVDNLGDKTDLTLIKPISARQLSTMVLRLCPDHISETFLYNASHDPLTGLMNYSRFKDQLAHTSSRAKRADKLTFAVLLILISEFEALKKKHGNLLMNQLMLAFVERLGTQIREVDTFCRLSEDKFAVLLEDIKEPSNAAIVAARIHIAFETPLKIQDQEIPIKLYVDRVHDHLIENVNAFISRD